MWTLDNICALFLLFHAEPLSIDSVADMLHNIHITGQSISLFQTTECFSFYMYCMFCILPSNEHI